MVMLINLDKNILMKHHFLFRFSAAVWCLYMLYIFFGVYNFFGGAIQCCHCSRSKMG